MANPQKENGFTSIANEILDEIALRKFNGTQFRIITVVWRYTYGFQRKSHEFSLNFLVENTGLSKDSIKRELKALITKKVLWIVKEADFNNARQLAFNKNYDEWKVKISDQLPQGEETYTGGENDTSTGGEKSPSTEGGFTPSTGGENAPYINKEKEKTKESKKESKKESRKSRIYDVDSVHYRLASRLYENILENNPNHKKPNLNKWADEVRLMMEQDNRTEEQIIYLMDWVKQESFWRAVILSTKKLRDKFDQLIIQVKERSTQGNRGHPKSVPRAYQSLQEWAEEEEAN